MNKFFRRPYCFKNFWIQILMRTENRYSTKHYTVIFLKGVQCHKITELVLADLIKKTLAMKNLGVASVGNKKQTVTL